MDEWRDDEWAVDDDAAQNSPELPPMGTLEKARLVRNFINLFDDFGDLTIPIKSINSEILREGWRWLKYKESKYIVRYGDDIPLGVKINIDKLPLTPAQVTVLRAKALIKIDKELASRDVLNIPDRDFERESTTFTVTVPKKRVHRSNKCHKGSECGIQGLSCTNSSCPHI